MSTNHPQLRLLTIQETAERLCCSATNVYALIECGALSYVRVGHAKGYRIDPSDLLEFIDSRKERKEGTRVSRAPRLPRLKHIKLN